MSGQAPDSPSSESKTEFTKYFMNRIKIMVRRENIVRGTASGRGMYRAIEADFAQVYLNLSQTPN